MGDYWYQRYKMSDRFRQDGSAQKVYNFANKQSYDSRVYSDTPCSSGSKAEEIPFGPYLKENSQKRSGENPIKLTLGKELLREMERRRSSPNVIAKLMGLNELPPRKGLNCNNTKIGGSFRKNEEFKDVFEVIDSSNSKRGRNEQIIKGPIEENNLMDGKFGANFEDYRDHFVKNLEKSSPLFSKHLRDLKLSLPNLHQNPIALLKSRNSTGRDTKIENLSALNPGIKKINLGKKGYCDHQEHIIVLNPGHPKTRNIQSIFLQNILDDFEQGRGKDRKFRSKRYINEGTYTGLSSKFEKLRQFEAGFQESKSSRTLAEMLALSDSEKSRKKFDLQRKGQARNIFSREECNKKESEGLFDNFLAESNLYRRRKDVMRSRNRSPSLRENFKPGANLQISKSKAGGSFPIQEYCAEEKTVFPIYEGQNCKLTTGTNPAREEAQIYGYKEKGRASIEREEEYYLKFPSYIDKFQNFKQIEQPSPVSVLDPPTMEEDKSSSSCLSRVTDLKDIQMQLDFPQFTRETEIYTSSSDDESNNGENYSWLDLLRDKEERDYSYLLDMLIRSGIRGAHPDMLRKACHSRERPVSPHVFDRLEKKYRRVLTWSKPERRYLFDLVNLVLSEVLAPCLDPHPWVRGGGKVGPMWGPEGLVERVWLVMDVEREKGVAVTEDEMVLDSEWLRNSGDDVNVIGKQMERMITDEILEEIVSEFLLG